MRAQTGQMTSTTWKTIVVPCQYNFNSGILASGKTRMAPKPSKPTTAWWLVSNLTDVPVAMKSQINNHKGKASPTQTWIALGKLVATYNFAASPFLHYMISTRVAVPKLWFLCSCLSRKDVGPNGPNNKHSLEDNLWHVASTTSTAASLRVARLGWLPSQAKLPLHDGWPRTWQMCQWPWNVKSTIS